MGACGAKLQQENSYSHQSNTVHTNHVLLDEESDPENDEPSLKYPYNETNNVSNKQNQENQYPTISSSDSIQSNQAAEAGNHIQNPTYFRLRQMGFNEALSKEASLQHPTNMNGATDYALSKQE